MKRQYKWPKSQQMKLTNVDQLNMHVVETPAWSIFSVSIGPSCARDGAPRANQVFIIPDDSMALIHHTDEYPC